MNISTILEDGVIEHKRLEYKSADARPASIVKQLVAMANRDGGQVIVGVKENDGEIVALQDVNSEGNPSGLEEALHNSIRDNVEPVIELDFELVEHNSKTLISISVTNSDRLHSFADNKPVFPIRHGSTTRYLSGLELPDRRLTPDQSTVDDSNSSATDPEKADGNDADKNTAQSGRRLSPIHPGWNNGTHMSTTVESLPDTDPPTYSAPANRLILETGGHRIAVFGSLGLDPMRTNNSTIRLKDYINLHKLENLASCIRTIEQRTTGSAYRSHSYAIKYGSRQLVGRGIDNFLQDAHRVPEICSRLLPGNQTATDSAKPVGVLTFPFQDGVGILEVQWDGASLRSGRSSFYTILENIPLDTTPYQDLYDELGGEPQSLKELTHVQSIRINRGSVIPLDETQIVTFRPEDEFVHQEVVAANPFYNAEEQISSAFDIDLPDTFVQTLSGLNRLPFDVSGGIHPEDESFGFRDIEMLQLDGLLSTFLVSPFSHVIDTEADITSVQIPGSTDNE